MYIRVIEAIKMKVEITRNGKNGYMDIIREESDPKLYSESTLLYHAAKKLKEMGYDVVKQLMWKDGHMYGDDHIHYIKTRYKHKADPDAFFAYDGDYALRSLYEPYNQRNKVTLIMEFGAYHG